MAILHIANMSKSHYSYYRLIPSRALGFVTACLLGITASEGSIIYQENFSAVDDWNVVYNQEGGSASITSDGSVATLSVGEPSNLVAFAPDPISVNFAPFTASQAGDVYLAYTADSVSGSTSYSIEIDQYDASETYISTVFSVIPQTAATGSYESTRFDNFTWSGSTAFILPKIQMYTGTGTQTIGFDSIQIIAVPEPSTTAFLLIGLLSSLILRRKLPSKQSL